MFKALILLHFCICLFVNYLHSQSLNGDVKGTFAVAIVATDGIIIAVDSRTTITGPNGESCAYFDRTPKLVLLNDEFPIAVAGTAMLGGNFVYNFIEEFNKTEQRGIGLRTFYSNFKSHVLHTSKDFGQTFICIGYNQSNLPFIVSFSKSDSGYNSVMGYSGSAFRKYVKKYTGMKLTCDQWRPIIESLIYEYAKGENKEFAVGGPISMAKMKPGNKMSWVQNDFRANKIKDYTSMVDLIEQKKISVTLVNGCTFKQLISAMKANPNYKPKK